ncbi:MAG: DUF4783 domain-containing protein [Candidatus Krumholzibacteria bacterium]|nr:DUF4783 domain-containing protein [Candidatus Krumholzibacteria bacterium]
MSRIIVYRVFVAILAVVLFFHAAVWAQQYYNQERIDKKVRRINTPLSVFKGIERAWKNSDAEALSRFAGKSRVFMNIRGIGQRGGYFSRAQVYFLLKRMFKTSNQLRFEFVKFRNLDKPDRRVYGIARRSYKNIRNGRLFQDKVYVTLRKEDSGWVVAELKMTW